VNAHEERRVLLFKRHWDRDNEIRKVRICFAVTMVMRRVCTRLQRDVAVQNFLHRYSSKAVTGERVHALINKLTTMYDE
jgi:hypothetical protein